MQRDLNCSQNGNQEKPMAGDLSFQSLLHGEFANIDDLLFPSAPTGTGNSTYVMDPLTPVWPVGGFDYHTFNPCILQEKDGSLRISVEVPPKMPPPPSVSTAPFHLPQFYDFYTSPPQTPQLLSPCSPTLDNDQTMHPYPRHPFPVVTIDTHASHSPIDNVPPTPTSVCSHSEKSPKRVKTAAKKKYTCTYPGCNREFPRLYNLKSHMLCHSGERPHVCPDCNASFGRKHDLQRHIRTLHNKNRPYICTTCQQGFSRPEALKRHSIFEKHPLPMLPQ